MNSAMSRWQKSPPNSSSWFIAERGGKGRPHRHHQPALLRVAPGLYQRPALQGRARPPDRPGAHHRDRVGVVPPPQNPEEETERISLGVFGSASAPPSGLRFSRTEHPRNHQRPKGGPEQPAEVGQARLPNSRVGLSTARKRISCICAEISVLESFSSWKAWIA